MTGLLRRAKGRAGRCEECATVGGLAAKYAVFQTGFGGYGDADGALLVFQFAASEVPGKIALQKYQR